MKSPLVDRYPKLSWLDGENIRPYVFVRQENRIKSPGERFPKFDWFPFSPLYRNPLMMKEVEFANLILRMEELAFDESGMAMPRWVFYDCAVVPGYVAGFAHKTETLPSSIKKALGIDPQREWTPISLFIIIPTMGDGEWVAHNLSSINSLIPREEKFYGLGFLTKAFALWYANIEICCGMTQWESPAIKLHSHYGSFQVLTAYTPVHSYAKTLTYRLIVDPSYWPGFFEKSEAGINDDLVPSGFEVNPKDEQDLMSFQSRIEGGEGPFYLNSAEVRKSDLSEPLTIYTKK